MDIKIISTRYGDGLKVYFDNQRDYELLIEYIDDYIEKFKELDMYCDSLETFKNNIQSRLRNGDDEKLETIIFVNQITNLFSLVLDMFICCQKVESKYTRELIDCRRTLIDNLNDSVAYGEARNEMFENGDFQTKTILKKLQDKINENKTKMNNE